MSNDNNGGKIIRFPGTPASGDPPAEEPVPPPEGKHIAGSTPYENFENFLDTEVLDTCTEFSELADVHDEERFWSLLGPLRDRINGWRRT